MEIEELDKYSLENIPEEILTSKHIDVIVIKETSNGCRYDIRCKTSHYKKFNELITKHNWPTSYSKYYNRIFSRNEVDTNYNITWCILDVKKSKKNSYPYYVKHNTFGPSSIVKSVANNNRDIMFKQEYFMYNMRCNEEEIKLIQLGLM